MCRREIWLVNTNERLSNPLPNLSEALQKVNLSKSTAGIYLFMCNLKWAPSSFIFRSLHLKSLQSSATDVVFPACNRVLSCRAACTAVGCMESGYVSTCVSVPWVSVCVRAYRCVMSTCLLFLTVDVCMSLAFLDGGNSIRLSGVLSTPTAPHTHTRTHTLITRHSADTRMSPRQQDTAKDVILTEGQRPPYWQAKGTQRGGLREQ